MEDYIDQNKLIDKYERLFAEEGWKEVVETMKERQRQLEKTVLVDSSIDLHKIGIAQGQNAVYDFLITLEATIAAVKDANTQALDLPEVDRAYQ